MIPLELELKNFLAYQSPPPLNFEGVHVACLAGENGAGKSSLLDAITWALWGRARSNSPDDLIHQGRTEMRVALTFAQGTDRYQVIRQRKAGKRGTSILEFQIWSPETESWRSLSESTIRDTQNRIDELLRLDYETFTNSAFLVQGQADAFTTKTPTQRKQVLANILGLGVWEVFEGRARDRITSTTAEIQRLEGRLEEIQRELAHRPDYESELEQAGEQAEIAGTKLAEAEKQWADLEGARAEMVSLQRSIDDLTRRITTRQKELAEFAAEQEELAARADGTALEAAWSQVKASLDALSPLQERFETLNDRHAELLEQTANLRGVNEALGPETEPLKIRLQTLQQADQPICPTCSQPLTDGHRHQLVENLEQEIAARRDHYRENREKIAQWEQQLEAVRQERNELQLRLKERPALEKRLGELQAAREHVDRSRRQLQKLNERIQRWQKELAEDLSQRQLLEKNIKASEARVQAAALTEADLEGLRREKRMADERVGGARQKLAALEAFETQQEQRQKERQGLSDDLSLYEALRDAFSKRGVPAMIIETAVPELERSANELLARMTDGRLHVRIETQREIKTGELREALDIIISDELGSRPYEMYSGGEAFRIDFAIRIALSRMLARRSGAQLRSLFIDEGFGTQDARGREHLVSAINSIQDDFDLILVITHIDELKEAFPARIEVTKTSKGSTYQFT
ncbi:MAG: AAA family ATPase [Anaerolineales bacterium]